MRVFGTFIFLLLPFWLVAQRPSGLADRFPVDSSLITICNAIELPAKLTFSGRHLEELEETKIREYIDYFLKQNPNGLKQAMYRQVTHLRYRENPMLALLGIAMSGFDGNYFNISFPVAAKYGLQMDAHVDGRYNFYQNYRCAVMWMKQQSSVFPLPEEVVLAFINSPGGLRNAITRADSRSINDIYPHLPENTRDTYFLYLALHEIYSRSQIPAEALRKHADQQHNRIKEVSAKKTFHFSVYELISPLNDVAQLNALNPTLISDVVPKGFSLRYLNPETPAVLDSIYFYQDSILNNPNYGKPAADSAQEKSVAIYYTVKKGDNLLMISRWFNMNIDDIQRWNSLSGDFIEAGQVLTLWTREEDAEDLGKLTLLSLPMKNELLNHTSFMEVLKDFEVYTVKKGDSLWSISKNHKGVTPDDLMKWNGISPAIEVGQKILVKDN